jgi:hypothetical protein
MNTLAWCRAEGWHADEQDSTLDRDGLYSLWMPTTSAVSNLVMDVCALYKPS